MTGAGSDPLGLIRVDESLSMAFLVLLERLTPVERAVFLLREVFEYEYSEIAAVLDQTEANCRQIFSRARQHVNALRPRFKVSAQKQSELLDRFLEAIGSGEMDGLVALLASDVVLQSDGGGKAIAVPNVVHGAANVARGILVGLRKVVPKEVVDVAAGRIRAIYIVTNPEKLSHLPELPSDGN